jgi:hypothetical protein
VPYVAWTHYSNKVAQLGYRRETFGGTDALGMAAQNHVLDWLSEAPYTHVLAEGDRLANAKFFSAVQAMGFRLHLFVLDLPQEVLDARRAARNAAIGKAQDDRWLATRKTKVTNLVSAMYPKILRGDFAVQDNVDVLTSLDPVCKEIAKLRAKLPVETAAPSRRTRRARATA